MRLHPSPTNFITTAAGVLLTTLALGCSLITVSHGSYRMPLLIAIVMAILAAFCFADPLVHGPLVWRLTALVFSAPLLFFVAFLPTGALRIRRFWNRRGRIWYP